MNISSEQSSFITGNAFLYLGSYASIGALTTAYPTSTYGHCAIVDSGGGNDASLYIYDEQEGWVVVSGGTSITLTTTGNSGASTLVSGTLNVPTYTLAGLGGITLTSLSATSPVAYDNSTGVFSITQAATAANGYLSSTDWNTFNGKQANLVSGTNIKSVNGNTLLGSGNLTVAGGMGALKTPYNVNVTGTTPTLIGSFRLNIGTYTVSAMIGSANPAHATTLLVKEGSTTRWTIGGSAGGISWQNSTASYAVTVDGTVFDMYLYNGNSAGIAYIQGLEVN